MAQEGMTVLLEMYDRPVLAYTRPARAGMLLRLDEPSVDFYRFLQDRAGTAFSRSRCDGVADEDVFHHLADEKVDVFVLFIGGAPAGFFELDHRKEGEVQLVSTGLVPEFQARGLGKYLVATAVETAWDEEPERVWVRADADDDPRGLLLYQWAGFVALETRKGAESH